MCTKSLARNGLFLVVAGLWACGQDNGFAGSPAVDAGTATESGQAEASAAATRFASSACKKDKVAKSAMAHIYGLMVIDDQAGLDGLSCVAWQRVGPGETKIDLFNFMSACGATWAGDAVLAADGTLELHVDNPSCAIAHCGKCLYDWSFDVNAAIPATQATPAVIAIDTCKGQQQPVQLLATLGAADAGISCAFADYGALNEYASVVGMCGKAGMPCVGSLFCGTGSFTSSGTCDSGLVCDSSAAVNEPRCLVPCATTADCPRSDAWSCQSGLCRPEI